MANRFVKICTNCKEQLPATAEYFHKEKCGVLGLRSMCKVCRQMRAMLERLQILGTVVGTETISIDEQYRRCYSCKQWTELTSKYFNKCSDGINGLQRTCKTCSRKKNLNHYLLNKKDYFEKSASRRATKLNATPIWVNRNQLKQVYEDCPENYHVDHIIPLQGKNVCGLHVPWNLQYLTPKQNLSKGNRLEGGTLQ
jgi:5-methylcytosine-specific restriction endonuclease McrA